MYKKREVTKDELKGFKKGYKIKEIEKLTGIKYSTLCDRIRQASLQPLYRISETKGPGTGKGNLYDIDKVLDLFRPKKCAGRPRTLDKKRGVNRG